MKRNNEGFTLAEMLIVVAIIGVLIAIVTTTISSSLERAREAADLANIRNVYSELYSAVVLGEGKKDWMKKNGNKANGYYYTAYVKVTQKKPGWQMYDNARYIQIGEDGYVVGMNSSKKLSEYYLLNYYFEPKTYLSAMQKQAGLTDVLIRFSCEMNAGDKRGTYVYPQN